MKPLAYILLLIIIGLGIAPWGVGMIVEKKYNQAHAQIKKNYGDELDFKIDYQRGYMVSIATTTIIDKQSGQSITIVDTIKNGPVIFNFSEFTKLSSYMPERFALAAIDTKFTGATEQAIQMLYAGKKAYSINTILDYNGSGATTFKIYPLETMSGPGSINWQGGEYTIKFDANFVDFQGQLFFPSLVYTEGENTIRVAQVAGSFDNNVNTMNGDFKFSIADISVIENGISTLGVKNINLNAKAIVDNQMMTGTLDYSMQDVNIDEDKYGPIGLNVTVNNVDAKIANELSQKTQAMSPEDEAQMLKFLQNKPNMDLTLEAKTPMGVVNIGSNLEVGGQRLESLDEDKILETVNFDANIKIAKDIIDIILREYVASQIQTKEAIYFMQNRDNQNAGPNPYVMTEEELKIFTDEWVGEFYKYMLGDKYWVDSGDQYATNIQFKDGVFTINGQEKTQLDYEYLEASLDITVAPKAKNSTEKTNPAASNQRNTEQPPSTDNTLEAPPSQLQPMTEGEAQQRLDAVPTPANTAPAM